MKKVNKNKGFSLVELIVVIAIMAVLVGILAPAYLKYVEKSRKSSDVQAVSELIRSGEAVATDEEYHVPSDAEFVISVASGVISLSVPADKWVDGEEDYRKLAETEWNEVGNQNHQLEIRSNTFAQLEGKAIGTFKTNGFIVWTIDSGDKIFTAMSKYSKDFKEKFSS